MKKGVAIELDKIRMLRYGINALVAIEDLTGKAITALDLANVKMKDLRTIIYAGLSHEDKELTPEKVGEIIDNFGSIEEIAEKVGEAMTLAFGKGGKADPKK